jgi:hypothetical protein
MQQLDVALTNHPFLSGTGRPDLADLSVFGVLRAIDGLPVHRTIVHDRAGPVSGWYSRMKEQVVGKQQQDNSKK